MRHFVGDPGGILGGYWGYISRKIKNICDRYNVPLKAAALQFGLMHPTVASTIPGPRNSDELKQNMNMATIEINPDLWKELKKEELIHMDCPE